MTSRGNLLSMKIPHSEITHKKVIGQLHGKRVFYIRTRGGLHLVVVENGEILAVGPHRAVTQHIAAKRNPDIKFTELSKSEFVDPDTIAFCLPEYQKLTDKFRSLQCWPR